MDDIQLIRDALVNADAFAEIYRMHVARVYRYHLIHIGNVKDAEELTSQTFMTVLNELRTFRGNNSLTAWVMEIATQKRLQDSRGNLRELPIDAVLYYQSAALSTDKLSMQRMAIETISHALKQISTDSAEAIILYFFSNLTSSEVSEVLRKSSTTVEMLIGRGIQDLRTRTSITASAENARTTNDPNAEEDALVEKLANTSSQIVLDPLFISELEQVLVAQHQPKIKRTLPLPLQQFVTVAGWVALMALAIFLLNWRVEPNAPSAQHTKTASQTPVITKVKSNVVASSPITRTPKPTATPLPVLEYIVQPGDNCTFIAERHGVTIDQLIAFNRLNSTCDIWVDQKLIIPIIVTTTP